MSEKPSAGDLASSVGSVKPYALQGPAAALPGPRTERCSGFSSTAAGRPAQRTPDQHVVAQAPDLGRRDAQRILQPYAAVDLGQRQRPDVAQDAGRYEDRSGVAQAGFEQRPEQPRA